MKPLLLMLALSTPLLANESSPVPRRWSLALPLSFPDGLGAELEYRSSPRLSLQLFYQRPTFIKVKALIKRRKLVDREGFQIRSPDIDLPFDVQWGPHYGIGASFRPFASAFYLMLAWETRMMTVDSLVQSHLEVIDSQNRMMSNTLFQAEASTQTQQTLLRPGFGYRWDLGESPYFLALYSGWSQPFQAHTRVRTEVRVRNPEASDPDEIDAHNLEEAEEQQERVIQQKLREELRKFENFGLPILGISFGRML